MKLKYWSLVLTTLIGVAGFVHSASEKSRQREVVVFEGEQGISVLDTSSHSASVWIKEAFDRPFSVSRNGIVAYASPSNAWSWRNSDIFVSLGLRESPLKITNDNHSLSPRISPDGSAIIYQKGESERSFQGDPIGRGIWLYDVRKKTHREVVGVVKIPPEVGGRKERIWGIKGEMSDKLWILDGWMSWSIDGQSFSFQRDFPYGPAVNFWVDLATEPVDVRILPAGVFPLSIGRSELIFGAEGVLYALEPRSGVKRPLASGLNGLATAQFSPDGSQIACLVCEQEERPCSIWLVRYATGEIKRLTGPLVSYVDFPVPLHWNQDGSKILVESQDATWIVDTKDASIKNIGTPITYPSWTTLPVSRAY